MDHVSDRPRTSREARFCCSPECFAAQLDYLARHSYIVLPLADLVRSLDEGTPVPSRAVAITFDDGSSCTYERALPILSEHRFPATVFMISGLIGRDNEWLSGAGFPKRRMLSGAELRQLEGGGMKVGSHTVSHPWLARIPLERARAELADSKAQLEDVLGNPVAHFAYPYGSYNEDVRNAVAEAGYSAACSTRWGKRHTSADLFSLRRVEVMGQDSLLQFALKLHVATHHMPPVAEPRDLLRRGLEKTGILKPRSSGHA
jgi:peptidoglycan/xylan/chitin deacetylase (PgdA/CDA1 family)